MRGKSPEKDNSERYLLTYADLMNLLLILFIVLYCSATKDVTRGYAVMEGIRKGFTGTTSVASATSKTGGSSAASSGISASGSKNPATTDYNNFFDQLLALLKQKGMLGNVDITDSQSEVIITFKDKVLFQPGRADLSNDATSILRSIGGLLKQVSFAQLLVEGHTDSDPIKTAQFRNNLELSQDRAYNVGEILLSAGVTPKKVLVLGCGEHYPVAPNDTVANKAKNRRVVIAILKKGVTDSDVAVASTDLFKKIQETINANTANTSSSTGKGKSKTSSSKGTKTPQKSTSSASGKK